MEEQPKCIDKLLKKHKNLIITKKGCIPCEEAIERLEESMVEYYNQRFDDLEEKEQEKLIEEIENDYKHRTFPVIFLDGRFVGGYDQLKEEVQPFNKTPPMAMQFELVSGKDLQPGHTYIPGDAPGSICKVVDAVKSKPGKHGSAKSVVSARDLFSNRNLSVTYKDGGEKVRKVKDFGYAHKVLYAVTDTELIYDIVATENNSFLVENFKYGKNKLIEKMKEVFPGLSGSEMYLDTDTAPWCLKYSEITSEGALVFWDLLQIPNDKLSSVGIKL